MPKYKLTYFNACARAEVSRLLFAAAGVEYEDDRFEISDWKDIKDSLKTPLGQIPVLEIDGVKYPQSVAHHRYLAKIFGFAGSNDLETLQCDVVVDTCNDFRIPYIRDVLVAHFFTKDEEKTTLNSHELASPGSSGVDYGLPFSQHNGNKQEEAAKVILLNEGLPKFLPVFEKFLSDYGGDSGYAVGSKLTYADFAIHEILELALSLWPNILEKHPKLAKHRQLVESNPKIRAYVEKRPKTLA